jgi:hypothetical protein
MNAQLIRSLRTVRSLSCLTLAVLVLSTAALADLSYPPALKDGQAVVSSRSPQMLRRSGETRADVRIAATAPTIDIFYFPGQDYPADPWSNWGDATYANGKFYTSIGDHLSPRGTALLYEFDPATKQVRVLANLRRFLETGDATHDPTERVEKGEAVKRGPNSLLHEGENYTPGKIHSRIDLGSDGWLYYSTHRGSPRTTTDAYGYRGDWIFRTHPGTGVTEVVAAYPLAKHCMPASVLDAQRMIFYAGTAEGRDAEAKDVHLVAYDVQSRQVLAALPGGFARNVMLDPESGKLFWDGKVYDPNTRSISEAPGVPDVRSATRARPDGWIYGTTGHSADIWGFNVRTAEVKQFGRGAVGSQGYVTSMEIDPTGRYLYYVPGAHGGGPRDGTPVIQFDLKTGTPKVLCFLHPYLYDNHGFIPEGTFGVALDDKGEKLLVTWNGKRSPDVRAWESCMGMVIHIPASERQP